jgi:hypothetical protein
MELIDILVGCVTIIALTVFTIFVISFCYGFYKAWQEAKGIIAKRDLESNLITLDLEVIIEQGIEMFLLYEHPHSTFALQATSAEDVAKKIFEKYKDKNVIIRQGGEQQTISTFTKV